MSFSNWKEVRLNDIAIKITKGTTPTTVGKQFTSSGINYYKAQCITSSKYLDKDNQMYIDEETHQKLQRSQLEEKDVLFSMAGIYLGKTCVVRKKDVPANINQAIALIRLNQESADVDYIYYYLNQKNIVMLINNMTSQSAQPNINLKQIGELKIKLPNLKEQKAIAYIISTIDEKIEINRQINKKLEEMAQAIFKQWFVDFEFPNEDGKPYKSSGGEMVESEMGMIPKGWNVKILGEVLDRIEAGNRPKGGAGNLTEGIPSIGAENIIGLGKYDYSKEKFVPEDYFGNMNKGIVKSEDVLLYKDGAQLGRKTMFMDGYPHEKCCVNSHVFILRTNDIISQSYLYFWLDQDYMTQNIINLNANSAQPGINQVQVKSLKILIPDKSIVDKFDITTLSLLKNIFSNCNTNNKLTKIRDTLLPKLMSGEIRVPINN